jgi:predicted GNAT superfamily acetyltransferase
MRYNQDKIDETVLATLLLTLHEENRAWKGHSFEVLDRLYEKGYIYNSKDKSKSVVLTSEGLAKAREVFDVLFGE